MASDAKAPIHALLAAAQRELAAGNAEAARAQLLKLVRRSPRHAPAHNLLGFIALRAGQFAEAETHLRQAVALGPDDSVFRENLALALSMQKDAPAAAAIRSALAATPEQAALWLALARTETNAHGAEAGAAVLYEGLSFCPDHPQLLHALANHLHQAGRLSEALTHYHHCLGVDSKSLELRLDLSLVYQRLLRLERAEAYAREAIALDTGSARAQSRLGAVLYLRHRFREAITCFERALALTPDDAKAHNQLGMAQMALGDARVALAGFREAVRLDAAYPVARSNLMLALLYSDKVSGAEIYREALEYRNFGAAAAKPSHANARDPKKRLRVGFISGDFRRHVVGTFLLPLFERHDRSRLEFFCYSTLDVPDPFTQILRGASEGWADIRALDDAALAARIRQDGIDVLIDLSGHTSDNRLPVFGRRPAPVQATWLGYPGTTGGPGVDYRLTDAVLDPPGCEAQSTEVPVRVSGAFFCYAPRAEWGGSLAVAPLPALHTGRITFGAFNNFAKVGPACLDLWAGILRRVPGSRLISRAKPFGDTAERARFVAQMVARGVEAARIEALPYLPDPVQHLRIYDDVDIHLDSVPYAGGTTSCDALWMGVPVVTLAGDRPSARLGASVLAALGLTGLTASRPEAYADIAVRLAGDFDALAAQRGRLRERFLASPLHDANAFALEFERACRGMWRRWCAGSR